MATINDIRLRWAVSCDLCEDNSGIIPKVLCEICKKMTCKNRCADVCPRCQRTICIRHAMLCTLREMNDCHQAICLYCAEEDQQWGKVECCERSYACPLCRKTHKMFDCSNCGISLCYRKQFYCQQRHIYCHSCYEEKVVRRIIRDNDNNPRDIGMCQLCLKHLKEDKIMEQPCIDCYRQNEVSLCEKCRANICPHISTRCGMKHQYCLQCEKTELISLEGKANFDDDLFLYKICKLCLT